MICQKCGSEMKPSKYEGGKPYCPTCYKKYKELKERQSTTNPNYQTAISPSDLEKINGNIQKLVAKLQDHEKRIGGLETMHTEEKQALELHQELHPKQSILGEEYDDIDIAKDINF